MSVQPRRSPLAESAEAQRVFDRRITLEWSQARLARESGYSSALISQIESGARRPSARTMKRLLAVMGGHVEPAAPEGWNGLAPRDRALIQQLIRTLYGRHGLSRTAAGRAEDRRSQGASDGV